MEEVGPPLKAQSEPRRRRKPFREGSVQAKPDDLGRGGGEEASEGARRMARGVEEPAEELENTGHLDPLAARPPRETKRALRSRGYIGPRPTRARARESHSARRRVQRCPRIRRRISSFLLKSSIRKPAAIRAMP